MVRDACYPRIFRAVMKMLKFELKSAKKMFELTLVKDGGRLQAQSDVCLRGKVSIVLTQGRIVQKKER